MQCKETTSILSQEIKQLQQIIAQKNQENHDLNEKWKDVSVILSQEIQQLRQTIFQQSQENQTLIHQRSQNEEFLSLQIQELQQSLHQKNQEESFKSERTKQNRAKMIQHIEMLKKTIHEQNQTIQSLQKQVTSLGKLANQRAIEFSELKKQTPPISRLQYQQLQAELQELKKNKQKSWTRWL